jgi:chaperone required for assembly of F1-ATPase
VKRFYKEASAAPAEGGFVIRLDGRPVRTPKKAELVLPTAALADAIAGEWSAQGERIVPASMPLCRLANTAIDWVGPERERISALLAGYGETDVVCYLAPEPEELAARQAAAWRPLLDWATRRYDARLRSTRALQPAPQDAAALAALRRALDGYDDMALMSVHDLVTISGSLVIGLALAEGAVNLEGAWAAALVEELFQAERWGEDEEAASRRARLRGELAAALRFLDLLRAR